MMDRAVKITLAVAVLTVGSSLAIVYRRPSPTLPESQLEDASRLVLRGPRWRPRPRTKKPENQHSRPAPQSAADAGGASTTSGHSEATGRGSIGGTIKSTVLSPIDTGTPPPRIARVFPRQESAQNSPWSYTLGRRPTEMDAYGTNRLMRTHTVADGDTLEELAARYFGDSSRGMEIFEANRNVLLDPNSLPIGVELVIGHPGCPSHRADGLLPDKPLVPVLPAAE